MGTNGVKKAISKLNKTLEDQSISIFMFTGVLICLTLSCTIVFILHKFYLNEIQNMLISRGDALYTAIGAASGAIFGFVITGVSIILALSPRGLIARITSDTRFQQILSYFFRSAFCLGFLTIISICGILFTKDGYLSLALFYCSILLATVSTFLLVMTVRVLEQLTKIAIYDVKQEVNKPPEPKQPVRPGKSFNSRMANAVPVEPIVENQKPD